MNFLLSTVKYNLLTCPSLLTQREFVHHYSVAHVHHHRSERTCSPLLCCSCPSSPIRENLFTITLLLMSIITDQRELVHHYSVAHVHHHRSERTCSPLLCCSCPSSPIRENLFTITLLLMSIITDQRELVHHYSVAHVHHHRSERTCSPLLCCSCPSSPIRENLFTITLLLMSIITDQRELVHHYSVAHVHHHRSERTYSPLLCCSCPSSPIRENLFTITLLLILSMLFILTIYTLGLKKFSTCSF